MLALRIRVNLTLFVRAIKEAVADFSPNCSRRNMTSLSLPRRPSNQPTEAEAAAHDAFWDAKRPNDWETGPYNICFNFLRKPSTRTPASAKSTPASTPGLEWGARLGVRAKNIPRLMRKGFHWSSANVQREQGHLTVHDKSKIPQDEFVHGWAHSRRYVIKDLGIDPEWTAELTIFAKEIAVLASFDVEFVTMQDMRRAKAWNWDDNLVYQYSEKSPGESFNAIYDDMPMHGWWPWPLRYEQSVVGDGWENVREKGGTT